ncbi:hypothetical protein N7474_002450 [Penicillium riverlandense]|uniref:uncharacterized protein n=1 Tax=Penicillium riverlandense TaxID=1903569 RepID=UPI0025474801|nr:uncharacterized protein N7474_002450 [Penicillium riverlandense]KAJ5825312.1 hypothetical protein N7474_002450 [Penicillium riverlandense]
MLPPKHSILPISGSDLPTLANFLHTSKLALTVNRLIFKYWPNDVTQLQLYTQAVEFGFSDPSVECLKVVDDESGDIVGYLALSRKQAENEEEKPAGSGEDPEPGVPDGLNPPVFKAVMGAVSGITKEFEKIDRFEVTYMCVKPRSRRHGIGSELVGKCFEKAKAANLPLVICAEPEAHPFFTAVGFKDTKHVDIDLSPWAPPYSGFGTFRLTGMIWSP